MKTTIKYLFASLLVTGLLGNNVVYAETTASSKEPVKAVKEALQSKKADDTTPVNINKADAKELATLKGLGAKKAEAVLAYRKEHGEFKTADELADVKGIGKKGFARLQEHNPGRVVLK